MSDVKSDAVSAAIGEAMVGQMTGKKWYESKTFWANVVMALGVAVQSKYGFVMGPEMQGFVMVGINLVLRKISKDAIVW